MKSKFYGHISVSKVGSYITILAGHQELEVTQAEAEQIVIGVCEVMAQTTTEAARLKLAASVTEILKIKSD